MGATEALSEAWEFLKSKPKVLLPWLGVHGILLLVAEFLPVLELGTGHDGALGSWVWIIVLFYFFFELALLAWARATTVLAVDTKAAGKEFALPGTLRAALARTPGLFFLYLVSLLLVGVTVGLPLVLTYFLFRGVVPLLIISWIAIGLGWGLLIFVRLTMAEAAFLLDRMGIVEAIASAWEAAKGRFWSLLGLVIGLGLFLFICELLGRIPSVGPFLELAGNVVGYYLRAAALAWMYLSAAEGALGPREP